MELLVDGRLATGEEPALNLFLTKKSSETSKPNLGVSRAASQLRS